MKFSLFALGFVTGTLATYLILTQWWWPDSRLEAARPMPPALAAGSPYPTPSAFTTPEGITPVEGGESLPSPTPYAGEPMPTAPPIETAALPVPPAETRALDLPLLQTDIDRLRMRGLLLPVRGLDPGSLRDTFSDDRGSRRHQAIDIMAPRGTPVLAADDGRVEKLFTSKPGGLTVYLFDAGSEYCYYYAHLDSYAAGLAPGKTLRRGDVIGYVGSTGNASPTAPHLHFTIFRLGPERRWWEGTAINPYPLWGRPVRP